jgi:hypothetical protein
LGVLGRCQILRAGNARSDLDWLCFAFVDFGLSCYLATPVFFLFLQEVSDAGRTAGIADQSVPRRYDERRVAH